MTQRVARAGIVFVLLFVLYQSAEGVGGRLLHSFAVQASLMLACVLVAWLLSRRLRRVRAGSRAGLVRVAGRRSRRCLRREGAGDRRG